MKSTQSIKISGIGILLLLFISTGCYYDKVLPIEPEGDISYAQDMQPFFDLKCISCHNGGSVPLNLNSGDSYDAIISGGYVNTTDAEASSLYAKINTGGSMEGYASDAERAITLKWIQQGANNN